MLEFIRRADGASLQEIAAATDWQAHSVRGFISGSLVKKMGLTPSYTHTGGVLRPAALAESDRSDFTA